MSDFWLVPIAVGFLLVVPLVSVGAAWLIGFYMRWVNFVFNHTSGGDRG